VNDVEDFKQSCETLTAKFAKIDKYSHTIANLFNANAAKKASKGGVWLPCCRPGVPCPSRVMFAVTSLDTHNCKSLITRCSEVKYCLLSSR
jgi:hypothetical protein